MDEVVIPAEGATEGNAEGAIDESKTTATAVAEKTPIASEPSPAVATKPDIASLLSDAETRQQALEQLQDEIDRKADEKAKQRFLSERGRVKQELEAEYEQRQQAAKEKADLERFLEMDETELGIETKQQLAQKREEQALQERLQPLEAKLKADILAQTGSIFFSKAYEMAQKLGLDKDEMEKINPLAYTDPAAWFEAMGDVLGDAKAKKLSKEMAKVEAKAMREAELAAEREKGTGPVVLTPGDGRRSYSREDLANMSPEEYRQHRDEVWEQLSRR